MFESGESSIHNYECGCPELITIFNILKKCPGVYGARFSGAGYRGCCIGLINPKYKDEIRNSIDEQYPKIHPKYKDSYKVYFSKTDSGARIIK
jgi:galactokinase/galacturonokinase